MNNDIFEDIVKKMKTITDKDDQLLKMDGLAIYNENILYHYFFSSKDELHELRSVCKFVVSMCLGIASAENIQVGEKPLSAETPVWPVIKDIVTVTNTENLNKLEKLTVKHLLTHTVGYEVKLLKSKDIKHMDPYTYLDFLVNYPIVHEPGEFFLYSNAAPYLLSAFLQEILGMNVSDYANDKIFKKLGIENYTWKNYGNYCAACTGLRLHLDDVIKLGLLLLNMGAYDGQQIIPSSWIERMTSAQVLTPEMYDKKRALPKYAYGYLVWVCESGTYYIDGTNGQYLIVVPHKNLVIATTGNQTDMKPITKCFVNIIE